MQPKRQKFEVKKNFRGFQVFDFKYGAKLKTRKLRKWAFFSNHIVKLKFFLPSHFFQFLDSEFHILPKIEVKENFPRFPSFRFWV